jgi:hypothetical protein
MPKFNIKWLEHDDTTLGPSEKPKFKQGKIYINMCEIFRIEG